MERTEIHLNDLFWSVQGEGRHWGRRSLFVRFPYCNYDCPWCDTEFNSYKTWSLEDFNDFATQEPARFAVITGGEPMAHKHLGIVLKTLKGLGFEIACETNGSLPVPNEIDFITTSPKQYTKGKFEPYYVHPDNWERTDEWKYVVDDSFDFDILDRHNPSAGTTFSLTPEFNQMKNQTQRVLAYIKQNPQWKLNLQTHKWIDVP